MTTDKQLVRERFEANFKRYDRLASVQQRICTELAQLVEQYCSAGEVERVLEVGVGTGFLTSRLAGHSPRAEWFLNDIAPAAESFVAKYVAGLKAEYLWGDAEEVEFPHDLDMIASASTVQWFDNLGAFIAKAAKSTRAGGYLVLSTFGKENFVEIRETTGEGLSYYTVEELRRMLVGAGYVPLHMSEYTDSLRFETAVDVLRHIKATGVNSLRKSHWSKKQLAQFENDYEERFATADGGITLTYHPILIVAQRV